MPRISLKYIALILPAILLFAYVAVRACVLSFTHDESLSFSIITGNNFWVNTANHHILNTRLMALSSYFFGNSEFVLRLPNVSAFALYLFSVIYIVKKSNNFYLSLFGFCILICNPFMLDFFSLARGYGLSLGFMLPALYFLVKNAALKKQDFNTNFILSSVYGALSVFANFSLINFFIALISIHSLLFIFSLFFHQKPTAKSKIIFAGILMLTLFPLVFVIKRLFLLEKLGELYFGESTFMHSIDSLIWHSFYGVNRPHEFILVIKYIVISVFLAGLISVIIKRDFKSGLGVITLLILLLVMGLNVEHYLFNSKFPIDRTALYFIPLFMLFTYYFTEHIFTYYKPNKLLAYFILTVLCLPLIFNLVINFNFRKTHLWSYDASTKDAALIINEKTKNRKTNAVISNNWLFEPALNYYIYSRKIKLKSANRDSLNLNADFIFRLNDNTAIEKFIVLKLYPDIDANLLIYSGFDPVK